MKKVLGLLSTILIILIATAQPLLAAPVSTSVARGDVNVDGQVNSNDAIYLLMYTQFPTTYPLLSGMDCDLKEDGYINSDDAIYLLMHTQFPDEYPIEEEAYVRTYIEPGSTGATVKEAQEAMNNLGYRDADGNKLEVNGIYDSKTEYAIKAFQTDYDFGPDGIMNPSGLTWSKIDEIGSTGYGVTFTSTTTTYINHTTQSKNIAANTEAIVLHTIPSGWSYVKEIGTDGDDGWVKSDTYVDRVSLTPYRNDAYTPHTINIVKELLNKYGFCDESGDALLLDGIYDDGLYYALRNFQGVVGLYKVGDMPYNGKTWNYLQNYNPTNVNYPDLYSGMTYSYYTQYAPYISMLNRYLNQLGYSAEKTDVAYWTTNTINAVKAFQTDYDLGADGYVGSGTWNALIKKFITNDTTTDADFEAELTAQGFPESYKVYLRRLHKLHPNWKFEAESAAHDWDTSLAIQYVNNGSQPISLMTKTWASCLVSTEFSNKTYDGGAWVVPSTKTISYFMDPRNFLDEISIFQFYENTYDEIYTESFVSEIANYLGMTYMSGTYTHEDGTTINYPKVIAELCKKYNYNPVAFISSVKQELGTSAEAVMITGTFSGYEGYYNYINFNAYQTSDMDPNTHGMYAASLKGWNTRQKALEGAISHYADNYIKAGQETIYYKKFNAKRSASVATHQFMSNISGAYSEGYTMGTALSSKLSDAQITFRIPVYSGMKDTNYLLPDCEN